MNRLLAGLAAFAVASSVAVAHAADLPLPLKAPPLVPPPADLWTGSYVGGFAGAAFGATDVLVTDCSGPTFTCTPGALPASFNLNTSFTGGVTWGMLQQAGHVVFGFESETAWVRMAGSGSLVGPIQPNIASATFGDWYATDMIRLGATGGFLNPGMGDNVLFYVKAGIVYGDFKNTLIYGNNAVTSAALTENLSGSNLIAGPAVGGGVEWKITPVWSIKGEYEFFDLQNAGNNACGLVLTPGLGPPVAPNISVCSQSTMKSFSTVKFGVNRSFDLMALLNGVLPH